MLFAGGGDVTFYFDFRTRSRSREMPSEVVQQAKQRRKALANNPLRKLTEENLAREDRLEALRERDKLEPKQPPSDPSFGRGRRAAEDDKASAMQKLQSRQANAEMAKDANLSRQLSLALRPRSLPELLAAGRALQVDLPTHPELVWMVDLVLCGDYIPIGWEKVQPGQEGSGGDQHDSELAAMPLEWRWQPGGAQYCAGAGADKQHYFNTLSRLRVDQHPVLGYVRSVKKTCVPKERPRGAGR